MGLMKLALAAVLVLGLGLAASRAPAAPSCRVGFTCPGAAGRVDVTLGGFDGSGATGNQAGVLDSDEIQCALDCLDGDPDPDHLMIGPKAPWTATQVRGGVIAFDPAVTYHVQRSLELPAAVRDQLRVDGQGARLIVKRASSDPIHVLERAAPAGANNCDAEAMVDWGWLWTIENLSIVGDGGAADEGIVLHGTGSPVVRDCWFDSLGTGVDLRFSISPAIDQCVFINDRRHDVVLGDGSQCGPDEKGACFGSCATGAAVFTQAGSTTRQLVEGGCNGAVVRHCRFLMTQSQSSSIRIFASRAPVIDGPVFDGTRGRHAIHYSHWLANNLTIRDMYFESSLERPDGVIRIDGGATLLVEGLHLVTDSAVAIDADAPDSTIIVRCVPWLPPGITFRNGSNSWRNEWRFEDVAAADLATPARWQDGPPPRRLVVDRIEDLKRPQAGATTSMSLPVGSPPDRGEKLQDGQIWLDPKTRRLMFCCDPYGRPKAASK
jgi:hypothetical protein